MNRNESLFNRAKAIIPGGVNSPVRAFGSVGGVPRFIKKAEGAYVWDENGTRYTDYVGSWGPAIVGHAHPEVIEAVREAALGGLSFGAPTEGEIVIAEEIAKIMPSVERLRLVSSGTEATMTAIRLARGFSIGRQPDPGAPLDTDRLQSVEVAQVNDGGLQGPYVADDVNGLGQAQDRVHGQLSGPVPGGLAATVHVDHRYVTGLDDVGAGPLPGVGPPADGVDRFVLHEQKGRGAAPLHDLAVNIPLPLPTLMEGDEPGTELHVLTQHGCSLRDHNRPPARGFGKG